LIIFEYSELTSHRLRELLAAALRLRTPNPKKRTACSSATLTPKFITRIKNDKILIRFIHIRNL